MSDYRFQVTSADDVKVGDELDVVVDGVTQRIVVTEKTDSGFSAIPKDNVGLAETLRAIDLGGAIR